MRGYFSPIIPSPFSFTTSNENCANTYFHTHLYTLEDFHVKANEYVHALRLEGNYVFSDNYFSLLRGEEITISYRKNFCDSKDESLTVKAFTIKL